MKIIDGREMQKQTKNQQKRQTQTEINKGVVGERGEAQKLQ